MQEIYLDNAATTRATETVVQVMNTYLRERYHNPSAMYHAGAALKNELQDARERMLKILKGEGTLIFTSGGTESDNLAFFGTKLKKGSRIIVGDAEHAAVYASAQTLLQKGYDVVFCPTDRAGRVHEKEFQSMLTENTALVSVMHVNNETGGINDIKSLCRLAKKACKDVLFHADGVQAFGKVSVNLRNFGVDLYSISAHKIGGPKGVGALFVKKGVGIMPVVVGGGQENGLRSSTENTAGIMAFAAAAEEADKMLTETHKNAYALFRFVADSLAQVLDLEFLSPSHENGGSPYIFTISSQKVRGEVMQHALEKEGILVGTGSACGANKASKRIPEALGLRNEYANGILRISFGKDNTMEEVKTFCKAYHRLYKELSLYGS